MEKKQWFAKSKTDVDNYTLGLVFSFTYVMVQALYICFRKILWWKDCWKIHNTWSTRWESWNWQESWGSWMPDKFSPPSCLSTPLHCSTPCRTWDGVNSHPSTAHVSANFLCLFFFKLYLLFFIYYFFIVLLSQSSIILRLFLSFIVELIIESVEEICSYRKNGVSQNAQGTRLNYILIGLWWNAAELSPYGNHTICWVKKQD